MAENSKTPPAPSTGPADSLRLALRPREMAAALGIGETLLWSLTNQRLIPHVKLGKAIVYPIGAAEKWLADEAEKAVRR